MKKNYLFIISILCLLAAGIQNAYPQNSRGVTVSNSVSNSSNSKHNAPASILFTDNFDTANDTNALKLRGYLPYNRSTGAPGLLPYWYTGTPAEFTSFNGPDSGYVAASYNTVVATNIIDSWLVLPPLDITAGDTLSFYSRSIQGSGYPDSLKVMYSAVGDSTPEDISWVEIGYFKVTTAGMWERRFFPAPASGTTARFAIRYYLTDAGPTGNNGDYIGIDQLDVYEPGTVGILENNFSSSHLQVFPVPVNDFTNIVFDSRESGLTNLIVRDVTGRVVLSKSLYAHFGMNDVRVDFSEYHPGIYIINITTQSERYISKIVKE